MVKVIVDKEQKLVEAQIGGFIKTEEALRVANELKKVLIQFGPQEAMLLIDLTGFAPMSSDVQSILRGMGRDVVGYFRKAALVQEFALQMPGRKVIEPPSGGKLPAYPTREEAIKYLNME
ncbi:MAG: hypothetical protein IH586_16795 [Anaerolineaceae bacterium]|nr:hypothetical protein [Anaerolineaceae bacterium]